MRRALPLSAALLASAASLGACSNDRTAVQSTEAGNCSALAGFSGAGVSIVASGEIHPDPVWESPASFPRPVEVQTPFCRVEGVIEGRVGFELWLPLPDAWNGRMLGAGVGGDAGVFNYSDLARGIAAGYAAITNDSGHKASEANWMMREEAVRDYTHRSQHMMNVAGRAIIDAYYAQPAHHAYFIGCSGGGRQALKEIQLYPDDYDGVVAGAAGPSMPVMSVRHLWQGLYQEQNPDGAMSDEVWNIVADAAVSTCDANDGVVDGVVETPTRCSFDPGVLVCSPDKPNACLTPEQVRTVLAFYAPLRDENGVQLDSGLVPGVRTRPGPPSPLLLPFFAQGAHHDPDWTPEHFNRAADLALAYQEMPEMAANNPDLRPFAESGGKAILYQGWLDPSIVAHQSIDYYEQVVETMGADAAESTARLFMAPGMLHCRGGAGVDVFGGSFASTPIGDASHDMLSAVVRWVEDGIAPDSIIASRIEDGQVTRQRPLCPYPREAKYLGGDSNRAENFECASPQSRSGE